MTTVSRDKIIEQLFPVKWRSVWTRWQGFKSEVGHWQYPWSEQVFTSALQLNTWLISDSKKLLSAWDAYHSSGVLKRWFLRAKQSYQVIGLGLEATLLTSMNEFFSDRINLETVSADKAKSLESLSRIRLDWATYRELGHNLMASCVSDESLKREVKPQKLLWIREGIKSVMEREYKTRYPWWRRWWHVFRGHKDLETYKDAHQQAEEAYQRYLSSLSTQSSQSLVPVENLNRDAGEERPVSSWVADREASQREETPRALLSSSDWAAIGEQWQKDADALKQWFREELLSLSRETLESEQTDKIESLGRLLRRRYHGLARRYHPDKQVPGGIPEARLSTRITQSLVQLHTDLMGLLEGQSQGKGLPNWLFGKTSPIYSMMDAIKWELEENGATLNKIAASLAHTQQELAHTQEDGRKLEQRLERTEQRAERTDRTLAILLQRFNLHADGDERPDDDASNDRPSFEASDEAPRSHSPR